MRLFITIIAMIILFMRTFFQEKRKLIKSKRGESSSKEELEVKSSFVKSLFRGVSIIEGYDFSISNGDDSDIVMHVYQEDKFLKLSFDVPELIPGRGNPTLRDYITEFNNVADNAETNIVKFAPPTRRRLNGIINFDYKIDNEVYHQSCILDKSIYADFADEKRDGLNSFIETVSEKGYSPKLIELVKEFYAPGEVEEFKITAIYLSYEISFMIAGDAGLGVTKESAKNVVINFAENTKVNKNGVNSTFGIVLFHPESCNFNKYYSLDEENNIIIEDINE